MASCPRPCALRRPSGHLTTEQPEEREFFARMAGERLRRCARTVPLTKSQGDTAADAVWRAPARMKKPRCSRRSDPADQGTGRSTSIKGSPSTTNAGGKFRLPKWPGRTQVCRGDLQVLTGAETTVAPRRFQDHLQYFSQNFQGLKILVSPVQSRPCPLSTRRIRRKTNTRTRFQRRQGVPKVRYKDWLSLYRWERFRAASGGRLAVVRAARGSDLQSLTTTIRRRPETLWRCHAIT